MKFEYNPEISLGNLLQIVSILGGIFVGYSTLVQANAVQDRVLQEHAIRLEEAKILARDERRELQTELKELQKSIKDLDVKFTDYVIQDSKQHRR